MIFKLNINKNLLFNKNYYKQLFNSARGNNYNKNLRRIQKFQVNLKNYFFFYSFFLYFKTKTKLAQRRFFQRSKKKYFKLLFRSITKKTYLFFVFKNFFKIFIFFKFSRYQNNFWNNFYQRPSKYLNFLYLYDQNLLNLLYGNKNTPQLLLLAPISGSKPQHSISKRLTKNINFFFFIKRPSFVSKFKINEFNCFQIKDAVDTFLLFSNSTIRSNFFFKLNKKQFFNKLATTYLFYYKNQKPVYSKNLIKFIFSKRSRISNRPRKFKKRLIFTKRIKPIVLKHLFFFKFIFFRRYKFKDFLWKYNRFLFRKKSFFVKNVLWFFKPRGRRPGWLSLKIKITGRRKYNFYSKLYFYKRLNFFFGRKKFCRYISRKFVFRTKDAFSRYYLNRYANVKIYYKKQYTWEKKKIKFLEFIFKNSFLLKKKKKRYKLKNSLGFAVNFKFLYNKALHKKTRRKTRRFRRFTPLSVRPVIKMGFINPINYSKLKYFNKKNCFALKKSSLLPLNHNYFFSRQLNKIDPVVANSHSNKPKHVLSFHKWRRIYYKHKPAELKTNHPVNLDLNKLRGYIKGGGDLNMQSYNKKQLKKKNKLKNFLIKKHFKYLNRASLLFKQKLLRLKNKFTKNTLLKNLLIKKKYFFLFKALIKKLNIYFENKYLNLLNYPGFIFIPNQLNFFFFILKCAKKNQINKTKILYFFKNFLLSKNSYFLDRRNMFFFLELLRNRKFNKFYFFKNFIYRSPLKKKNKYLKRTLFFSVLKRLFSSFDFYKKHNNRFLKTLSNIFLNFKQKYNQATYKLFSNKKFTFFYGSSLFKKFIKRFSTYPLFKIVPILKMGLAELGDSFQYRHIYYNKLKRFKKILGFFKYHFIFFDFFLNKFYFNGLMNLIFKKKIFHSKVNKISASKENKYIIISKKRFRQRRLRLYSTRMTRIKFVYLKNKKNLYKKISKYKMLLSTGLKLLGRSQKRSLGLKKKKFFKISQPRFSHKFNLKKNELLYNRKLKKKIFFNNLRFEKKIVIALGKYRRNKTRIKYFFKNKRHTTVVKTKMFYNTKIKYFIVKRRLKNPKIVWIKKKILFKKFLPKKIFLFNEKLILKKNFFQRNFYYHIFFLLTTAKIKHWKRVLKNPLFTRRNRYKRICLWLSRVTKFRHWHRAWKKFFFNSINKIRYVPVQVTYRKYLLKKKTKSRVLWIKKKIKFEKFLIKKSKNRGLLRKQRKELNDSLFFFKKNFFLKILTPKKLIQKNNFYYTPGSTAATKFFFFKPQLFKTVGLRRIYLKTYSIQHIKNKNFFRGISKNTGVSVYLKKKFIFLRVRKKIKIKSKAVIKSNIFKKLKKNLKHKPSLFKHKLFFKRKAGHKKKIKVKFFSMFKTLEKNSVVNYSSNFFMANVIKTKLSNFYSFLRFSVHHKIFLFNYAKHKNSFIFFNSLYNFYYFPSNKYFKKINSYYKQILKIKKFSKKYFLLKKKKQITFLLKRRKFLKPFMRRYWFKKKKKWRNRYFVNYIKWRKKNRPKSLFFYGRIKLVKRKGINSFVKQSKKSKKINFFFKKRFFFMRRFSIYKKRNQCSLLKSWMVRLAKNDTLLGKPYSSNNYNNVLSGDLNLAHTFSRSKPFNIHNANDWCVQKFPLVQTNLFQTKCLVKHVNLNKKHRLFIYKNTKNAYKYPTNQVTKKQIVLSSTFSRLFYNFYKKVLKNFIRNKGYLLANYFLPALNDAKINFFQKIKRFFFLNKQINFYKPIFFVFKNSRFFFLSSPCGFYKIQKNLSCSFLIFTFFYKIRLIKLFLSTYHLVSNSVSSFFDFYFKNLSNKRINFYTNRFSKRYWRIKFFRSRLALKILSSKIKYKKLSSQRQDFLHTTKRLKGKKYYLKFKKFYPASGRFKWRIYLLKKKWNYFFNMGADKGGDFPWVDYVVHKTNLFSTRFYFQYNRAKFPMWQKKYKPYKNLTFFYSALGFYSSRYLYQSHYIINKIFSTHFNRCKKNYFYKIFHHYKNSSFKMIDRSSKPYSYFSKFLCSVVYHLNFVPTSFWACKLIRSGFFFSSQGF